MGPPGASCRWVLDQLVDCRRHVRRRGGQRGWDSGRSAWSRSVRCCGLARGRGLRRVAERAGVDRKTARRYVEAAQAAGLTREAGVGRGDRRAGRAVVEAVRPARPNGHGAAWEALLGARGADPGVGRRRTRRGQARAVVDREDRGAAGPAGRAGAVSDAAPVRGGAVRVPHRARHHGPGRRRRARGGVPARLRPAGAAERPGDRARRRVHALIFTAVLCRHMFVWLTYSQTLTAVIAGCEAAWGFFGGVFKVLIPDNLKPVVTDADAVNPTPRAGLAGLRPARRVRHRPGQGPLAAGQAAGRAGRAVRPRQLLGRGDLRRPGRRPGPGRGLVRASGPGCGSTAPPQRRPAEVFAELEAACLLPVPAPYDVADLHAGSRCTATSTSRSPRRCTRSPSSSSAATSTPAPTASWSSSTPPAGGAAGQDPPPAAARRPVHRPRRPARAQGRLRDAGPDPADRGLRRARTEHRHLRRTAARRPAALDQDAQRLPAPGPGPPLRPRTRSRPPAAGRWTSTWSACRRSPRCWPRPPSNSSRCCPPRPAPATTPGRPVRPRPQRVRPPHTTTTRTTPTSVQLTLIPGGTHGPRRHPRQRPNDGSTTNEHHEHDDGARTGQGRSGRPGRRRPDPHAEGAQARPDDPHPARTARPGPAAEDEPRRVPRSSSWPTRSPAATPARRCCAPAPPGSTRPCAWTPGTSPTTSPTTATCSPTWPPCGSPRPATASWSSARSGSARPTWPRRSGTSRSDAGSRVHAARADKLFTRLARRPARQHPRGRDPQARPRRPAHPRRLRAQTARRDRDQRLLRARRRTAPQGQHDRDLEPRARRVADHDERRAARPVRRRPAHLRRAHPRHRGPVLPATTHRHRRAAVDPEGGHSDAHSHLQVVPCSWQRGGPITLASDTVLHDDPIGPGRARRTGWTRAAGVVGAGWSWAGRVPPRYAGMTTTNRGEPRALPTMKPGAPHELLIVGSAGSSGGLLSRGSTQPSRRWRVAMRPRTLRVQEMAFWSGVSSGLRIEAAATAIGMAGQTGRRTSARLAG